MEKEGVDIAVVNHFRDLGGHVCMDLSKCATTLNERIERAISKIERLKWIKISRNRKLSIIKTDILQAALYGSETIKASKKSIQRLRSAIANAIGPCSKHRAIELVFEANDIGKDVDPMVQTLVRKVALIRRIIDKFPEMKQVYVNNISSYQKFYQRGINNPKRHEVANTRDNEMGPIGLLADELYSCGAMLNENLEITQDNEMPINIELMPWQELKRQVEGIAKRQRIKETIKEEPIWAK